MWRIEIRIVRDGTRDTYTVAAESKEQGEKFQEFLMSALDGSIKARSMCVTTIDGEQIVFQVADLFTCRLYETVEEE